MPTPISDAAFVALVDQYYSDNSDNPWTGEELRTLFLHISASKVNFDNPSTIRSDQSDVKFDWPKVLYLNHGVNLAFEDFANYVAVAESEVLIQYTGSTDPAIAGHFPEGTTLRDYNFQSGQTNWIKLTYLSTNSYIVDTVPGTGSGTGSPQQGINTWNHTNLASAQSNGLIAVGDLLILDDDGDGQPAGYIIAGTGPLALGVQVFDNQTGVSNGIQWYRYADNAAAAADGDLAVNDYYLVDDDGDGDHAFYVVCSISPLVGKKIGDGSPVSDNPEVHTFDNVGVAILDSTVEVDDLVILKDNGNNVPGVYRAASVSPLLLQQLSSLVTYQSANPATSSTPDDSGRVAVSIDGVTNYFDSAFTYDIATRILGLLGSQGIGIDLGDDNAATIGTLIKKEKFQLISGSTRNITVSADSGSFLAGRGDVQDTTFQFPSISSISNQADGVQFTIVHWEGPNNTIVSIPTSDAIDHSAVSIDETITEVSTNSQFTITQVGKGYTFTLDKANSRWRVTSKKLSGDVVFLDNLDGTFDITIGGASAITFDARTYFGTTNTDRFFNILGTDSFQSSLSSAALSIWHQQKAISGGDSGIVLTKQQSGVVYVSDGTGATASVCTIPNATNFSSDDAPYFTVIRGPGTQNLLIRFTDTSENTIFQDTYAIDESIVPGGGNQDITITEQGKGYTFSYDTGRGGWVCVKKHSGDIASTDLNVYGGHDAAIAAGLSAGDAFLSPNRELRVVTADNWHETAETSAFTINPGDKSTPVDTSGGAVAVTIGANFRPGDEIVLFDPNGNWSTNNVTMSFDGTTYNLHGSSGAFTGDTDYAHVVFRMIETGTGNFIMVKKN